MEIGIRPFEKERVVEWGNPLWCGGKAPLYLTQDGL